LFSNLGPKKKCEVLSKARYTTTDTALEEGFRKPGAKEVRRAIMAKRVSTGWGTKG